MTQHSPALPSLADASALVTGASGGIGGAIVERLLSHSAAATVVAVSRGASRAASLAALAARFPDRLQCIDADLTDSASLAALGDAAHRCAHPLTLVVNAAGLLHGTGLRPEKSVRDIDLASLQRVFALNAFAPALLAQTLLPAMPVARPAVFASLSARVGSIGDNRLGGWYAYRASKAAHNQLLRTLAIELARTHPLLTCVSLHPGTVDTPLSKPFQRGVAPDRLFSTETAAIHLLTVIAGLRPQHSGSFLAWDGSAIPW